METLIWLGAATSLAGLVLLLWCIARVWKARRAQTDDDALRALVRRLVPVNSGALFLSVIGLMMVVAGTLLG